MQYAKEAMWLILIFISLISCNMSANASAVSSADKPVLYYVYDPLCGWCYGFSPVIAEVQKQYSDQISVEVISGGMVLAERVGPLSDIAPYIRDGVKRVESMTGVEFGQAYLDDLFGEGKRIMNSWPACLALTVFKSLQPDRALEYASELQKAIYFDGFESTDMNAFADAAERLGADKTAFLSRTQDQQFMLETRHEFGFAKDLKASGYPYVVLKKDATYYLVAHGYTDLATVRKRLDNILAD
jgi:putative protein-disulfide isomerase